MRHDDIRKTLGIFEAWPRQGPRMGRETKARATDETTAATRPKKAKITFQKIARLTAGFFMPYDMR